MKDLGELKFFLGIEFSRSDKGILMTQRKYALELLSATGLGGAKPVHTPLELNKRLTSIQYDEHVNGSSPDHDKPLANPEMYQKLVGKLLYLTMTRPDLAFTAQVLSQFMHCPKESHMEATLRAVKYIKETPGLGLLMPAEQTTQLTTYCDSDWGACLETRKSVTGYLVKFGGGLISWKSKKQGTVSRSSAEVEFRSMATCAAEITWLIGLYKELGVNITVPVKMFLTTPKKAKRNTIVRCEIESSYMLPIICKNNKLALLRENRQRLDHRKDDGNEHQIPIAMTNAKSVMPLQSLFMLKEQREYT
ncbi:uncharacterized mitochondrial protein AtMg00810-like [Solanum verrucosum]|uniref:uncharacterized mitochondrial protein AtMg00810-like n=1 Tax=Solanum verrucosum TaxID=315347 RepID=UPI0020D1215A|nr:uncharacterized mitochondrial protein AtMg00810-like [Solanum verrucosum]